MFSQPKSARLRKRAGASKSDEGSEQDGGDGDTTDAERGEWTLWAHICQAKGRVAISLPPSSCPAALLFPPNILGGHQ